MDCRASPHSHLSGGSQTAGGSRPTPRESRDAQRQTPGPYGLKDLSILLVNRFRRASIFSRFGGVHQAAVTTRDLQTVTLQSPRRSPAASQAPLQEFSYWSATADRKSTRL